MFIQVMPNGSMLWRLRYRFEGKQKLLALGAYPEVSLKRAREKRFEARTLLSEGKDPSFEKQEEKKKRSAEAANTFEIVARKWHEYSKDKHGWSQKYAKTIMTRLEADVFNRMGSLPINSINAVKMFEVLQDIEKRGVYEITRRVKQMCGQIFRYAITKGLVEYDATSGIDKKALSSKPVVHQVSIEPSELPQFLKDLYRNDARMYPTTRYAIEFILHTFVRTTELIKAKWSEFDFESATWTIPANRMKMKKIHIVPLSTQVLGILEDLKRYNGNYEWVFASATRPLDHMSDNAILKALERMGYRGRMTGHGFRSLAMTTILEKLEYPFDVVDAQLAHAKRTSLGAAYDRAKYLTQRRKMMQDWSNYIESITVGGDNVIEVKFG